MRMLVSLSIFFCASAAWSSTFINLKLETDVALSEVDYRFDDQTNYPNHAADVSSQRLMIFLGKNSSYISRGILIIDLPTGAIEKKIKIDESEASYDFRWGPGRLIQYSSSKMGGTLLVDSTTGETLKLPVYCDYSSARTFCVDYRKETVFTPLRERQLFQFSPVQQDGDSGYAFSENDTFATHWFTDNRGSYFFDLFETRSWKKIDSESRIRVPSDPWSERGVSIDPNGKYLAGPKAKVTGSCTYSDTGPGGVFEISTGRLIQTLGEFEHAETIRMAWDPTGRWLAYTYKECADNYYRFSIWDSTLRELLPLGRVISSDWDRNLSWSPDGKYLRVGSYDVLSAEDMNQGKFGVYHRFAGELISNGALHFFGPDRLYAIDPPLVGEPGVRLRVYRIVPTK